MSGYLLFGRLHTSWPQSQPAQQVGALTKLSSLFLAASSIVVLTINSTAGAEIDACVAHNIRLYGGKTNFDGGLLVQTAGGQWQRLCVQWDYAGVQFQDLEEPVQIAQVICRSLGFRSEKASAIFYEYRAEQLPSTSDDFITILTLKCRGNESQISECHALSQEVNVSALKFNETERNCFSGIACGDDPHFSIALDESYNLKQQFISFINETRSAVATGSLEVSAFGLKGLVCANPWHHVNQARVAQVACHELGLRTNTSFKGIALIREHSSSPFVRDASLHRGTSCLMPDTVCTGHEQSIAACSHLKIWGSTELYLRRANAWYGEQVLISCLTKSTNGFQLTTDKQLVNGSTGNDGVFIKYGSDWLPVINSLNPNSCRAICNALYMEGPSTAICRQESLSRNIESEGSDYAAHIDCDRDQIDVTHCAHYVTPMEDVAFRDVRRLFAHHVYARCMPQQLNNTSNVQLELHPFPNLGNGRNITVGCLRIILDNQHRIFVSNAHLENAQSTAQMTCQHVYPNEETYAAYINLDLQDEVTDPRNMMDFRSMPGCPQAMAFIGCKSNAKSIAECSILMQNRQSLLFRPALGIICARSKKDITIELSSKVHGHDGLITLWFGPYQALVSLVGWGDIAASVACREQHYSNTSAHRAIRKALTYRMHEWLLTIINCTGSENALLECKHEWKYTSLTFGSYVAGASCQRATFEFAILPFSNRSNSGYATIKFYEGNSLGRYYFCSVSEILMTREREVIWAQTNSDIAFCKAAGYPRTKNAERLILSKDDVPTTSGLSLKDAFAFRNFICQGKDSPLEECMHDELVPIKNCPRPQLSSPVRSLLLALRCDEYEFGTMVRLVGGATPYEGHVEVMYKGEWGAVCDDRFDADASTVVCRQLFGPMSQGQPVPGSRFATKNERFLLDEVRCSRVHQTLAECAHNVWGDHDCGPCQQIGVICSNVKFIRQPIVRLKNERGRQQLVCAAEGQPPPSYQWFTTGTPLMVASDRIDVVCQELDTVQYTCNAFNDAGERFVQVVLDINTTCDESTVENASISTSKSWIIALTGVGIGILLLLLLGALWKILSLRRSRQEVLYSDGKDHNNAAYINLNESPRN